IDGVSWRVLLEDLQVTYARVQRGEAPALPPKSSSVRAWSRALATRGDAAYWEEALAAAPSEFPRDVATDDAVIGDAADATLRFDRQITERLLREAPAAYRTQVNDLLLSALVRAVRGWTNDERVLVELEGHGREDVGDDLDVSRTVGWFSSYHPVL